MMEDPQPKGCVEWLCYKTWFPFKTLKSIMIFAFILGALFIILAIVLFAVYVNTFEYEVVYSTNGKCQGTQSGSNCQMTIDIPQNLNPPILIMYSLGNAYINHRKYISSISPTQLLGQPLSMSAAQAQCTPFVLNKDLQVNTSYTGVPLNPSAIAYPCGFKSYLNFNDTYTLFDSAGTQIPINQSSLDPQDSALYHSRAGTANEQWISVNNQHYQLWVQNQAMINKYKLWGRIEQPLAKGKYSLVIKDNYHIGNLKLDKGVDFIIPSRMGGPVYFYPITFMIMGVFCIVYALYMKYDMGDYDEVMKAHQQ